MIRKRNLRGRMLLGFLLAALIPILIFALVSQFNTWSWQQENLNERMQTNLDTADRCLNILLDKYATILFDLCTDDTVLDTVDEINHNKDILDVNTSKLRHELSHICNRNEGVEGITIFLENGQIVFYDKQNASSVISEWADQVCCPEVKNGEVYQGVLEAVKTDNQQIYLFQIARNLVDYKDIHKKMGTVVISIDEKVIANAMQAGANAKGYLLDGSTVISAPAFSKIGTKFEDIKDEKRNYYASKKNEITGFDICIERNLDSYNRSQNLQIILLLTVSLIAMGTMVLMSYNFTRPYLNMVGIFENSLKEVEKGNFSVQVELPEHMPAEIQNIREGFNEMVVHLDELIQKEKQSSLEQKNAELSALEAQIDPHFLYNTLDAINWKAIEQDQPEISTMLVSLANILRYTVENAGGTTTLEQELGWLNECIILQGARLGRIPIIRIDVPEELLGFTMHKLLIQPFVENAVKYGFAGKEDICVLRISANNIGNQVHLTIEDNGGGMDEKVLRKLNDETAEMEGHLGVSNVRKRLKLYYGEDATVYFESQKGNYTRVHLFIPKNNREG